MMQKLRKVDDDRDFDLSDSFSRGPLRITQAQFFQTDRLVIAIGELNRPNRWDDAAFDSAAAFLQTAWNEAVAAENARSAA